MTGQTQGPKKAKTQVTIHINKERFTVEVPILGSPLRDLGMIPVENQLFLELPGEDPDLLINPDTSYNLKNGSHLFDLPRGTVGGRTS